MRTKIVIAAMASAMLVAGSAAAQSSSGAAALAGDWTGVLPGPSPTHVIVHVRAAADGTTTATYDNVERNVRGVPLSDFKREGDTVSFALPAANIRYEATLEADGRTLTGGISVGTNLPQPLVLSRMPQ